MPSVLLRSGRRFNAEPGSTLLAAAQAAGINLPYSCKTGRCNSCRCQVVSGASTVISAELGLTDDERSAGWILSCCRAAEGDLVLDVEDFGDVQIPAAKTVPCRISQIERVTPDIVRIQLRLPPTADFHFLPGQYIDVIGSGGTRRSYSLANAPRPDKTLELHIRAVDGGAMSQYWFEQAKANDLLRLNGPLGTFFLRNVAGRHLVLLATGTGIAPVKAMLEQLAVDRAEPAKQETLPASVTVLWGGRQAADLYLDIANLYPFCRFIPVLSRASDDWPGQRGYIQDVLVAQTLDLGSASVFACGSDAMINSARARLVSAGLPAERFYSDAFVCSAV